MTNVRPPPPRPRRWRRLWVSEHAHAVGLLLATFLFLVAYIWLHSCFEKSYKKDIFPEVRNAVKLYGLREDGRTGALEFTVDGRAYVVGSTEPGPLGVNQIASVRGLLADTSRAIAAYNAQLAEYVEQVRGSFTLSRRNPIYSWAPLSAIAPALAAKPDSEESASNESAEAEDAEAEKAESSATSRIEIFTAQLSTLRELPPSEGTAGRLIAALQGGFVRRMSDVYPLPLQSANNASASPSVDPLRAY